MNETVKSARLHESYTKITHKSGLTILLYPMEGFSGAYALFGTKYGSVDTCFKTQDDDDFVTVPEGIAHFLEHKLFESEDGDAFTRYAKTGASANAYTSFERTAYLFSCTENFSESIEILLDFVTAPYFTKETVEKEQGIIGQEIKMYDDSPDWRVFFNMLRALYHNNPVRVDIAGTVDSIAKIDADLLHRCYRTFYNLNNMALAVAGNFKIEEVLAAADKILKPAPRMDIERKTAEEPKTALQKEIEQRLPVAQPLFHIGYKACAGRTEKETLLNQVLDEVLLDIIAGESSPLYRKLYDEGLINATFSTESMASRDYAVNIFSGESRDPKAVHEAIAGQIDSMKRDGIDKIAFDRAKKAAYGRYIGMYGKVEAVAGILLTSYFAGTDAYEVLEAVADITREALEYRLRQNFDAGCRTLSVVRS